MKTKNQYRGWLTADQVADGMNAARKNASRLAEDAEVLLQAKRYPSALALAILAIEESGKSHVFRQLALAITSHELKSRWREYRTHTAKNQHWILIHLARSGARRLEDFQSMFLDGAEHPALLDDLKQVAVYTDCVDDARWSSPENQVKPELAKEIVMVARALTSSEREISSREIALWIEYMGPVMRTSDFAAQKAALIRWGKAVADEGLAPASAVDMERLVEGDWFKAKS